jgi:hypothetical protein
MSNVGRGCWLVHDCEAREFVIVKFELRGVRGAGVNSSRFFSVMADMRRSRGTTGPCNRHVGPMASPGQRFPVIDPCEVASGPFSLALTDISQFSNQRYAVREGLVSRITQRETPFVGITSVPNRSLKSPLR